MECPPASYEELRATVAETNFGTFDARYQAEDFLRVIWMDSNPDEIVKSLPYDTSTPPGIWFVLPNSESLKLAVTKYENTDRD